MFEAWKNYRYISVSFHPDSDAQCYISEDRTVCAGNVVIVPSEPDNRLALVLGAETYRGGKVPYPVLQTARIICRADLLTEKAFQKAYRSAQCKIGRRCRKGEGRRGHWKKIEHLFGPTVYVCGICKRGFKTFPPACPNCHAQMTCIKDEMVWEEELEFFDEMDE